MTLGQKLLITVRGPRKANGPQRSLRDRDDVGVKGKLSDLARTHVRVSEIASAGECAMIRSRIWETLGETSQRIKEFLVRGLIRNDV